jgi:hypothetical protein
MAIIQDTVGPMIEQRVKPYDDVSNEWRLEKEFSQKDMEIQKLASEEFPGVEFDSVIRPAIKKYYDEMDERDPKRTIQVDYVDAYYRATRPLLRELTESKGRQEIRDKNKANLRPLGTGTSSKTGEPPVKGRSAREEAESFLEARGIR